jgi:hypothetical protein
MSAEIICENDKTVEMKTLEVYEYAIIAEENEYTIYHNMIIRVFSNKEGHKVAMAIGENHAWPDISNNTLKVKKLIPGTIIQIVVE